MSQQNLLDFIYNQEYQGDQALLEQDKTFLTVKNALENIPIDDRFFPAAEALIKWYKFSILICFETPYKKIAANPDLATKYENQIKKIAKIAFLHSQQKKVKQLSFLYFKGIDQKYNEEIKTSKVKKQFVDYIISLSEKKLQLKQLLIDDELELDDVDEFMKMESKKPLKYFEKNFENYLKSYGRQLQIKLGGKPTPLDQIVTAASSNSKAQTSQEKTNSQEKNKPPSSSQQPANPNPNSSTKDSLSPLQSRVAPPAQEQTTPTHVCCRKFFYNKQTIFQPQSLIICYKFFPWPLRDKAFIQIIKTVCSMLNSQGGHIFIGIRQDSVSFKKQVIGYFMIVSQAKQLMNAIYQEIDFCVKPALSSSGGMFKISLVPIKDKKSGSFISGKYILKLWVRHGDRKQIYSYVQDRRQKKQYFPFKTEGGINIVESCQHLFKLCEKRLFEPEPAPKPVHEWKCPEPDVGRPVYDVSEFENQGGDNNNGGNDHNSRNQNNRNNNNDDVDFPSLQPAHQQQHRLKDSTSKKKYIVVNPNPNDVPSQYFLLQGITQEKLKSCLQPKLYAEMTIIQKQVRVNSLPNSYIFIKLSNPKLIQDIQETLLTAQQQQLSEVKLAQVHTSIKVNTSEEFETLKLVAHQQKIDFKQGEDGGDGGKAFLARFQGIGNAINIYLKLAELSIKGEFVLYKNN